MAHRAGRRSGAGGCTYRLGAGALSIQPPLRRDVRRLGGGMMRGFHASRDGSPSFRASRTGDRVGSRGDRARRHVDRVDRAHPVCRSAGSLRRYPV